MDDVSRICTNLMECQVIRKLYIRAANARINTAEATVRRFLYRPGASATEQKQINAQAKRIVATFVKKKPHHKDDTLAAAATRQVIEALLAGLPVVLKERAGVEREMKRLAKQLPVHPWAKGVRGLGDLGLAVIIGEAGDLTFRGLDAQGRRRGYPHYKMLWKRLGLAPYMGKAMSVWRCKGGLSKDEWKELGYVPRRRAEIFACVQAPLFKLQSKSAKNPEAGQYRRVYDARRAQCEAAHQNDQAWPKARLHADAMRIMTKQLLSDLWSEWGRSIEILATRLEMASPTNIALAAPPEAASP